MVMAIFCIGNLQFFQISFFFFQSQNPVGATYNRHYSYVQ